MSDVAYYSGGSGAPVAEAPTDRATDLVQELLNTAFLVATSASIANHSAARGFVHADNKLLASYLPPRFKGKPERNSESTPVSDFLQGHMRLLSETIVSVCELSRLVINVDTCTLDQAIIANCWQRAASQVFPIVAQCQVEQNFESANDLQSKIRLALTLLTAVCRGDWPCVDEDGSVVLPVSIERRENVRAHSGRYAFFGVNGSIQRTLVENVSSQGLGIFGLDGATPGTPVTLMIAPGSTIDGQIVWVQGKQAGIRFDRLLPGPLVDALVY